MTSSSKDFGLILKAIVASGELIKAMEMQEKRESGEFHISQETALVIWNEAKEKGKRFLKLVEEK